MDNITIKNARELRDNAEQVDTKANNIDNLSSFGKLLSNNIVQTQQKNKLKAI